MIGQEVVRNERIVTGPTGQTQILLLDESAITVGPNSTLTLDEFVYDPSSGAGHLDMSATDGIVRFVGGKVSKGKNAVALRTPTAVLGVRGGIFLMRLVHGTLEVVFLYGDALTVTGNNVTQTITRPGFAVTVTGPGATPRRRARRRAACSLACSAS
jgi:hypothetical protein